MLPDEGTLSSEELALQRRSESARGNSSYFLAEGGRKAVASPVEHELLEVRQDDLARIGKEELRELQAPHGAVHLAVARAELGRDRGERGLRLPREMECHEQVLSFQHSRKTSRIVIRDVRDHDS